MIITELRKSQLSQYNLYIKETPVDGILKKFDRSLLLIWNADDNQFEVYREKIPGLDPTYHWQLSVPKGQLLSSWIIGWLQKHDTNPLGMKSKDELEGNFLKHLPSMVNEVEFRKEKEYIDKVIEPYRDFHREASKEKRVFGTRMPIIPVCVGLNQRTGKRIYAYKK